MITLDIDTRKELGRVQFEIVKKRVLRVQDFRCPYSLEKVNIHSPLHHALITRADISGWKDVAKRALILAEPRNCIVVSTAAHAVVEGNRRWAWSVLCSFYGEEAMVHWYTSLEGFFRGGLPIKIEYFREGG